MSQSPGGSDIRRQSCSDEWIPTAITGVVFVSTRGLWSALGFSTSFLFENVLRFIVQPKENETIQVLYNRA